MMEHKWEPSSGDKEWVFYRKGMSEEEFNEEYDYLVQHFDEYKAGTYVPLWKQHKGQESDS